MLDIQLIRKQPDDVKRRLNQRGTDYTAVIDGVIHDTHDPQRGDTFRFDEAGQYQRLGGGRCVYGYWGKA